MFTTTASATTSFSTTPVTAKTETKIAIETGRHDDDNNDEFAEGDNGAGSHSSNYSLSSSSSSNSKGSYGNNDYQQMSTPRSGQHDVPTTTTTTASPSSPTPAKRSKPHRRGLASAKAASAGGDRGHQVTRPSPLRSMMTAT